jgi:hypothetical protein
MDFFGPFLLMACTALNVSLEQRLGSSRRSRNMPVGSRLAEEPLNHEIAALQSKCYRMNFLLG